MSIVGSLISSPISSPIIRSPIDYNDIAWSLDLLSGSIGELTLIRSSAGYAYNSSGVLTSYGVDTPRFDYNPSTLSSRGLLIEELRTNLLLQSRNFNTTWTKVTLSSITTGHQSLFGDNGSWLVSNTATSSRLEQTITVSTGYNVVGILTKQSSGAALGMRIDNNSKVWQYNLNYETKTLSKGGTLDAVAYGVYDFGNGWLYPWFVYNATGTSSIVRFYPNSSVAGTSCYLDNSQAGLGSAPTSPIVTSSTAVTRAYDSVSMVDLMPLGIDFSAFTVVVEWEYSGVLANTGYVLSLSDGTYNNYIAFRANSIATQYGFKVAFGGSSSAESYSTLASAGIQKQALAIKENDFAYCINGGTVVTDASGVVPTFNRMYVGSGANGTGAFLNGWVRKISLYNGRLPDAQLQALTA